MAVFHTGVLVCKQMRSETLFCGFCLLTNFFSFFFKITTDQRIWFKDLAKKNIHLDRKRRKT